MRAPTDMPQARRRGSNRGRIALVVLAVALFILVLSLRGIAGFWTDYLWFDALDLGGVFTRILTSQIALAAIFTVAFFAITWVNLIVADRIGPKFRPSGPEEELLIKYHDVVDRRAGLVRAGIALVFALMFGVGAASQWNEWILFTNRQDFGVTDPLFGLDAGFYVFQLPFLLYVVDWLFVSLIIVLIVTAVAHYLNGGIRLQTPLERVTPQVKVHISVLLGALALVKAADYWLQRYELLFSTDGVIDGASYTQVNAQLPAANLLLLISLLSCVLFIANIWRKGWVLPVTAVALWAFVAIVAGTAYPAFVQKFQVEPQESAREAEYIAENIEFTRVALGLDEVEVIPVTIDEELDAADLDANAATIRNIRLLDPGVVDDTYQRLQADKGFYRFNDLDVDRYVVTAEDGSEQVNQVVLSNRELSTSGIPRKSWQGEHVNYTHGYGLALAPSNEVTSNGSPVFMVRDVPVEVSEEIEAKVDQPQIYHGEGLGGYAVVGTDEEIDYVADDNETVTAPYEGEGGVDSRGSGFGGILRQAAFALRFGEIDPLISEFVTSDSKVIYVRDVKERVEKAAPFLDYDADPYPVVVDGRIVYVVDAYTTTDLFPYGQVADTGQLASNSGLRHRFNYVRNSAKAVVDAYDGSVVLYVMPDPETGEPDPILMAYREAFPDLFADFDEMPDALRDHLRYPEDLFRVQTSMWGKYHLSDPQEFYEEGAAWEVAQDPGTAVPQGSAANVPVTNPQGEEVVLREARIPPYYLQMVLPDEEEDEFIMIRPFVPLSQGDERKELTSYMVAKSDRDTYGRLQVYELDEAVDGPAIINSNINKEEEISSRISLLNQQGSEVVFGNLLLIPIEDSILYVRPLYVQAEGETPVPQLKSIIVAFGGDIEIGDTLLEALSKVFSDPSEVAVLEDIFESQLVAPIDSTEDPEVDPDPSDSGDEDPPDTDATVEELLAEAAVLLEEAEAALDENDLGTYQDKVKEATAKIALAIELSGVAGGSSPEGDSGDAESGDAGGEGDPGAGSASPGESPTTTSPQLASL